MEFIQGSLRLQTKRLRIQRSAQVLNNKLSVNVIAIHVLVFFFVLFYMYVTVMPTRVIVALGLRVSAVTSRPALSGETISIVERHAAKCLTARSIATRGAATRARTRRFWAVSAATRRSVATLTCARPTARWTVAAAARVWRKGGTRRACVRQASQALSAKYVRQSLQDRLLAHDVVTTLLTIVGWIT